jgi:hypothetical protein
MELSRVSGDGPHHPHDWLTRFGRAWRERDPQAVGDLFTEHAVYRSDPFRPALAGRTEIVHYWTVATKGQTGVAVTFGAPLIRGDRMAVEWWSVMDMDGHPTTDAGGLFLTFEDGLCSELREYWNLTEEVVAVPEGWGH